MYCKKLFLLLLSVAVVTTSISQEKEYKAYLVSNAHFDTQWNWDVQKSIRDYVSKTLNQNILLMEKYPGYVFNFEGGIKYSWMKEYYPLQYEKIKEYIRQGRWHITGSTWDATDVNVPSPESLTRNILYAQQFYKQEFNVQGTDVFLPDCFGFGWTLPTIAAHSGLIGFSTQKLQWRHLPFHQNSKIPFEMGLWKGIDGSKIMLVADAHNYTTKWKDEDLSQSEYLLNLAKSNSTKSVYHYYGTGDTGGAPDMQSVRAVDKSLQGKGPLRIISASSDQLYKDYLPYDQHPELPVYTGELLMDVHATGCYTSQATMKSYNRKNELLADAAERASVAADWLGVLPYQKNTLTEAWKRVIWHQFHDDLTGTSIPKAYEFSWNDELISMKQFSQVLTSSVAAIASQLNTDVKGTPVVIYNPHASQVSEIVTVAIPSTLKSPNVQVYDEKGKSVAAQVTVDTGGKSNIVFAATVPASGFAVYEIRSGKDTRVNSPLKVTANSIENKFYKVTLDQNGDISSIIDKSENRELVQTGKSVRLALFTENESFDWPAWEILKKTIDGKPVSITSDVKISIAENGPVRSSLCVERKHGTSVFKQYIRLTDGGQDDRIDIENEIDWQSTNALLKAEFPFNLNSPEAIYDLGVGSIKRGNNKPNAYEVYAQKWVDMFDNQLNYGVSVFNDSKYGWDKPDDHTIRLTLLHTPKTKGNFSYQSKQDFGKHQFTYSIYGHKNEYTQAQTVVKAEIQNQSLKAFVAEKQKGNLGKSFSFLSISNDAIQLKALKQAENSDEMVVRLYESKGVNTQTASIVFPSEIESAVEVNGVEKEIQQASFENNSLKISMTPFSMKTFRVKLKDVNKYPANTAFTQLPLKYNIRTASFNAFYDEVNFDGKGNSYAAELLPKVLNYNGVEFNLPAPESFNAVKCKGDTIQLPAGNYNQVILLAASTRNDTEAAFAVDGITQHVVIPHYTGIIGQWGHTGHTEGFIQNQDIAYVGTHLHNSKNNLDMPMEYTYLFPVIIDLPKNAKELVLPYQSGVIVFAAVAAYVKNKAKPASDLLRVNLPEKTYEKVGSELKNLVFGKRVIEKSGQVNQFETAEMAIDEDIDTKWCDVSAKSERFITIDMGKSETISKWFVKHAGDESSSYITKDFCLQIRQKPSDLWKTIDTVINNTVNETERVLSSPQNARYIRLLITKSEQGDSKAARIYEFGVN